MHALSLVILLTVAAGAGAQDRPIPAGCGEDHGICREDCTIQYGGNMKKLHQLTACLQRCDKQVHTCRDRYYSLQDARGEPLPVRKPEPEPEPAPRPERVVEPAVHAEPATAEPEKLDAESIPIFDEPEPEPEPAPRPKPEPTRAVEHPPAPPEPKKDISDWDPNGD